MIERVGPFAGDATVGEVNEAAVLPATAAGDILVLVISSYQNADPAIGGTSGLTWTKKTFEQLNEPVPHRVSLWWARATGNHAGQTVVGGSGGGAKYCSISGAVYRGCVAAGDPFRSAGAYAIGLNEGWEWAIEEGTQALAGDYLVVGAGTIIGSPRPLNSERYVYGNDSEMGWVEPEPDLAAYSGAEEEPSSPTCSQLLDYAQTTPETIWYGAWSHWAGLTQSAGVGGVLMAAEEGEEQPPIPRPGTLSLLGVGR